jgi:tetratricopeptide (TPR) repeat protein
LQRVASGAWPRAASGFDAGDLARAEVLAKELATESSSDALRAPALQLAAQLAARRSGFSEASSHAAAALRIAGTDRRLAAAIELELVYCAVSLGEIASGVNHARAAVSHAQAAGEDGILADALAVLTMAEFLSGQGLDHARLAEALTLEDSGSSSAFIMRPRVISGMLELWAGEPERALDALGRVRAEIIERGQEGAVPFMSLYLVWAHVWRGDLGRAARVGEEAVEEAMLLEDSASLGLALSASALAHAHDGRTERARAEASEALSLFERVQWRSGMLWPLWALGLALLSERQPAGVHEVLGPLADQVAAMGGGDPVLLVFLPGEIEALIALGELDQAQTYPEPFERSAARLDRAWALGAAERCRGALEAARAEPEEAFAAYDRALAAHERVTMPFERARTLLLAGQAYRRFKQRGRARALLDEALSVFEKVGAPLWAERARVELARTGRPGAGRDELTRERATAGRARGLRPFQPGSRRAGVRDRQDRRGQPHPGLPQARRAVSGGAGELAAGR